MDFRSILSSSTESLFSILFEIAFKFSITWRRIDILMMIVIPLLNTTAVQHYSLSRVWFFATPWTVAHQAPLSMVFPRQEYWSGLPFHSLGISLTKGSNPCLLHWQVDSLALSHLSSPHDISCHNSLRTGLKEMETNWSCNRRLTVPRTTNMTLISPLITNLKMTVRADCVVFAWSLLLLSTIALTHWLLVVGVSLWTDNTLTLKLLASKIKQTSFHQSGLFLAFEWQAAEPHFL